MPRRALLMVTLLMSSVATYACSIEENFHGSGHCSDEPNSDDDDGWFSDSEDEPWKDCDKDGNNDPGADLCADYCAKMVSCSAIELTDYDSCMSVCQVAQQNHPDDTQSGCSCTIKQSCEDVVDDPCDGAPVPPEECPNDDDCTPTDPPDKQACNASCECAEGEQCIEGFCTPDAPPPVSCNADCECPSGETCADGICIQ